MTLQTIKMRELGAHGVISDLADSETPISAWSEARNIRFNNKQAFKSNGYIPIFYNNRESALKFDGKDQIPMHLIVKPLSVDEWIYATNNMIWKTNGWDHTKLWLDEEVKLDIPYDAPWSSTIISNSVILHSSQLSAPLGMVSGGDTGGFKPLAKWGKWNANTIRSYKNFAMALGGGDTFPQRVRWSDIVPPNALPANWGWEINESTGAEDKFIDGSAGGYNDLSFAVGKVIDGHPLRDSFIIYTDEEVITCDYVGGNDIFRFRKLFDEGGAINTDCVATFDNKHFVVSANDIYIHNGSTKESVIDSKIRTSILEEITENSYLSVKVVPYLTENEIWVIYAGNDATGFYKDGTLVAERKEATKAAIYNYTSKTWSFIDLPRTIYMHLGPIPIYDESGNDVKNWEKLPEDYLWEDGIELWNITGGTAQNFKRYSVACASADGGFYVIDRGEYFTYLGEKDPITNRYALTRKDVISTLNKYYIDMDELTDTVNYKTLLSLWPQIEGTGDLYIQVGGAHTSGGNIEWQEPVRFICSKDRKVDLRSNYRYLCVKIQSKGVGDWKLFGMDAIVRIGGKR